MLMHDSEFLVNLVTYTTLGTQFVNCVLRSKFKDQEHQDTELASNHSAALKPKLSSRNRQF